MKGVLTTILSFVLVWGTIGCGSEDAAVYMAEARSAHERFERDLIEAPQETQSVRDARLDRASDQLETFLELPAPQSVNAEDARVLRQDMYFRLAELSLERNDALGARNWAESGLNEGLGEDVFTANLYVVRGTAREASGDDIEAAADYHEALLINDALLQRLLGDGDEP